MNIYLITCDTADYDECQAWVVLAQDPDAALTFVRDEGHRSRTNEYPHAIYESTNSVDIEQLGTTPETEPRIAYVAFRAG